MPEVLILPALVGGYLALLGGRYRISIGVRAALRRRLSGSGRPSGQQEWHGARAGTVRRSDESSSGRTGVLVLAGMMLLLVLILVAGMIAAANGPALPGPYAPIKNNLDSP